MSRSVEKILDIEKDAKVLTILQGAWYNKYFKGSNFYHGGVGAQGEDFDYLLIYNSLTRANALAKRIDVYIRQLPSLKKIWILHPLTSSFDYNNREQFLLTKSFKGTSLQFQVRRYEISPKLAISEILVPTNRLKTAGNNPKSAEKKYKEELNFDFEFPEDISEEEVMRILKRVVGLADDAHRSLGGSGLKVKDISLGNLILVGRELA